MNLLRRGGGGVGFGANGGGGGGPRVREPEGGLTKVKSRIVKCIESDGRRGVE